MMRVTGRRMISSLINNKPSGVAEKQKIFTSSKEFTWLKAGSSDKRTFYIGLGLIGFGFVNFAKGFYNMAWGIGKKET